MRNTVQPLQKYNRWTVLRKLEEGRVKNIRWECRCDCGTIGLVTAGALNGGGSKSCGCLWKETMRKEDAGFLALYGKYKAAAIERGLVFCLTHDEFRILTQGNCFYCGIEPLQKTRGKYVRYCYNGIDRLNNLAGYTTENCKSCCALCNRAKGWTEFEVFKEWLERLLKHQNEINGTSKVI